MNGRRCLRYDNSRLVPAKYLPTPGKTAKMRVWMRCVLQPITLLSLLVERSQAAHRAAGTSLDPTAPTLVNPYLLLRILPPTMAFVTATFAVSAGAAPAAAVSSFRGARVAGARRARPAALTMNLDTIQQKIAEEMAKATAATEKHGKSSKEAALAWDIVEELEAEASHMKANQKSTDPLDKYCEDSPEADEVR